MPPFILTVLSLPLWAPLLSALVAGGLIGVERSNRSEPAGFRTHAVVCVASAAAVLAGVNAGLQLHDPATASRLAQGLLTGLGFLGAGVIVREGLSVHGLTTAASVWSVAALGVVFGYGFYAEGAAATVLLLALLHALKTLDRRLPRHGVADVSVRYAEGRAMPEHELRALLAEFGMTSGVIRHRKRGGEIEHATHVHGIGPIPTEAFSAALDARPGVVGFDIEPRSV